MSKTGFGEVDALYLLTRKHGTLRRRFGDYQRLVKGHGGDECKALVAGQICFHLSIHLQIEEELFYPAARAAIGGNALVNHAVRDHPGVKALLARLDEMAPGAADYDAAVAFLGAWVLPHFDEERDDIFPKLRMAGLETAALGRRMASRQKALQRGVTGIGLPHSNAVARPPASRVAVA